eukprot:7136462-Prymnesium_polylepis.1
MLRVCGVLERQTAAGAPAPARGAPGGRGNSRRGVWHGPQREGASGGPYLLDNAGEDAVARDGVVLATHPHERHEERRHATTLKEPAYPRITLLHLRQKLCQLLHRTDSPAERRVALKLPQHGLEGAKEDGAGRALLLLPL